MKHSEEVQKEIARVAFAIYERRGTGGLEEADWLEAEKIVLASIAERKSGAASEKPPAPAKKVRKPRKTAKPSNDT